jgi:hypothetical protein
MVIVFVPCKATWPKEFSVIVYDLRNINICLSQCQTLMAIVTYEGVEDKLHTFLTSLLDADGWSPLTLTQRKPTLT